MLSQTLREGDVFTLSMTDNEDTLLSLMFYEEPLATFDVLEDIYSFSTLVFWQRDCNLEICRGFSYE